MKIKIIGTSGDEIFESIRANIAASQLKNGDALPPVRELANELGMNRNTIAAVYQRLVKAGLAETKGRLGTRIKAAPMAGIQEGITDTQLIDLADGNLKREWFPDLNQLAGQCDLKHCLYGEPPILPQLESFALKWMQQDCPAPVHITLTSGAVDAMERLFACHLIPGDKVAVEDPCYLGASNSIRLAGLTAVGVAMDEHGILPHELEKVLDKGVRALVITPRAQNPTGRSLSAERASALREVLAQYPGVLLMLDDHFALIADTPYYSVIPEGHHHWALFRSVSKGLGPDMRLAFVASDSLTAQRLQSRLTSSMSWVSRILQSLVLTCLTSDQIQRQLGETKRLCHQNRNALIRALQEHGVDASASKDGLNLWVPVNRESQAAAYELSKLGWLVRPGEQFDIQQNSNFVRITIAKLDADTVEKLARDLAQM